MSKKYKAGFEKKFDGYVDAYDFYVKNKNNTEDGSYMALGVRDCCVRVRKIERYKGNGIQVKYTGKAIYGFGADGMQDTFNHADGKWYDSKSQYIKAVKAKGYEIVGNDLNNKEFKRPEVRGDFNVRAQMQEAVQKVLQQQGR